MRTFAVLAAVLGLLVLAGCEQGKYQEDKGPPPKVTEEDRARMEGLSLEEYRRQQQLKANGGPGQAGGPKAGAPAGAPAGR